MAEFIILGSGTVDAPKDADGHPYRLLKDQVKVFGGTWSDCVEKGFELGSDDDTFTIGTAPNAVNRNMKELREEHAALRKIVLGD